jgi:hypothetical protein
MTRELSNLGSQTSVKLEDETEQLLERALIKLNGNVLGIVLGLLAGAAIFVATNFLILKGGDVVGPHLGLLRAFFPYYSVTFLGSLVGFVYCFVCGYVVGLVIASVYNLVVKLRS